MPSVAGSWEIVTWLWEASGSTAIRGLHPRWNNHLWASHSRAGGSQSSDNERCGVCHRESKRARPEVWGRTHEMTPASFPPWKPNPWTDPCTVDHRQWWTSFSPSFIFFSFFYTLLFILSFVDFANFLSVRTKFWLDFDIVKNLCTFTHRPNGLLLSNAGSNVRFNLIDWIQIPRLCSHVWIFAPLVLLFKKRPPGFLITKITNR